MENELDLNKPDCNGSAAREKSGTEEGKCLLIWFSNFVRFLLSRICGIVEMTCC